MKSNKKLSIIVPCKNESEVLNEFYSKTIEVLNKITNNYEIIFINDGSTDNTFEIMMGLYEKDKNIIILNLSRNFGKEIALTAGLDYSTGDAVIPIDADLQDPPELMIALWTKWQEGFDVVYATRMERKGETLIKKFTAYMFYIVIAKLVNIKIPKNTGDYRLMDKKVVKALKSLKERNRFMKGIFSWVGYKQTGVMYNREPRFAGKSKFNFLKLTAFAIEGITSFTYKPLRIASILGILTFLFSILYSLFIVIHKLTTGNDPSGYASTVIFILFFGGIQLLSIGLIGEYVGRIYDEVKQRPLYIIDSIFKNTNIK
ncbi:MAG: glycosyltransferase family 2 protein [bacterium]